MTVSTSVQSCPAIPNERFRNALRIHIDRAVNISRTTTRTQLAADSGVNVYQIDAITSRDPAKHRRVAMEDGMSLAYVLGPDAMRSLLAVFGWTGRPIDEADEDCPRESAVASLTALSVFMSCAADGRIDHVEQPKATEAVDTIIAELVPFSSAGRKA